MAKAANGKNPFSIDYEVISTTRHKARGLVNEVKGFTTHSPYVLISIEIISLQLFTENIHVIPLPIKWIFIELCFLISQAFDSKQTIKPIIHAPVASC